MAREFLGSVFNILDAQFETIRRLEAEIKRLGMYERAWREVAESCAGHPLSAEEFARWNLPAGGEDAS